MHAIIYHDDFITMYKLWLPIVSELDPVHIATGAAHVFEARLNCQYNRIRQFSVYIAIEIRQHFSAEIPTNLLVIYTQCQVRIYIYKTP